MLKKRLFDGMIGNNSLNTEVYFIILRYVFILIPCILTTIAS